MSFFTSNYFLAFTALVISFVLVNTAIQTNFSGWLYQTIELLLIFEVVSAILKLVPADYFVRQVDAALDCDFIYEAVKPLYLEIDRPSYGSACF